MPQVPDIRVPTVAAGGPAAPALQVQDDPSKFGLQVGEAKARKAGAVEQGADVAANAVVRFQRIRNETEVDDVYANKFSPEFRKKYQEYYSLQGKEALDKLPDYIKGMEELQQETTNSLSNPAQKHMFQQAARRRVQAELDGMARHADQQNKVWQANTSDSYLRNQLDQAADFYNDEQKFGSALGAGLGEIDRYAGQTGQSSDQARDRASKFISAAWVSRIERMMLDKPLEADALYKANVANFDAAQRAVIEHKLKQAVMPVQARTIADAVMEEKPSRSVDARASLQGWVKEGEKRAEQMYPDNPVFRDLVASRIQSRVSILVNGMQGVERQARDSLTTAALADGGKDKPVNIEQLLSSPDLKNAWTQIDGMSQRSILAILEHNQRKTDPPLNSESLALYYKLKGQATNDPEAFVAGDLTPHFAALPHALSHELIVQQSAMARKEVRDQEKQLNVQHALSIAKPSLLAAGVYDSKAKSGSSKAAVYDQFVGRYTQQIDQFIANNKRRPNDKELQEITNSLLTSGAESGSGWFLDKSKRAFEVDAGKFYVPVPKTERQKIVDEYVRVRGVPPTDAQIQQVYTIHQLKKGAK